MVERAYFTLPARELGEWLRKHGEASWWTVDGDYLLGGRLALPCPATALADALQRIPGNLLLIDKFRMAASPGIVIDAEELNAHVQADSAGNRVLEFAWQKTPDVDWLLIEDKESAELANQLANEPN